MKQLVQKLEREMVYRSVNDLLFPQSLGRPTRIKCQRHGVDSFRTTVQVKRRQHQPEVMVVAFQRGAPTQASVDNEPTPKS